jgi:hypothetical protein
MKKWAIGLGAIGVIIFAILIYQALNKTPVVDDGHTQTATTEQKNAEQVRVQETTGSESSKAVIAAPLTGTETPEEFNKKLDGLIEQNRVEVEECEGQLDRIFIGNIEDRNDVIYKEENIIEALEDFDQAPVVAKSSSRLLEALASEQVKALKPEELSLKLRELRPCRPYKKMTFMHNLIDHYGKKKWSETTKTRVVESLFKYMEREVSDRTTLSNLNMQVALLQSMVTEGVLPKKFEEKVLDFKDQLEDSYDDLLDKADEAREVQEEKGQTADQIPVDIIRDEFKLEGQYRESFIGMLQELKKAR